jgi:phage terminase large subunit-like protein
MASPPLWMTTVSSDDVARGDGDLVTEFQQSYCRTTKDGFYGKAGQLIQFRPWQKTLVGCAYARRPDHRYKHRTCLIGLPRKNGKSALGSGCGLYGLLTGGTGAEVYSLACDKDQARIVFGVAKTMVKMEPQLDHEQGGPIKCYQNVLENTQTGGIYKALSSDAFTKEGLNPTLAIYDELHAAPNDELWDVINNAFGARSDPMLIAITTAGVKLDTTGGESVCYRLFQYGQKVISGEIYDPTFFLAWWGAPDDSDPGDRSVVEAANPAYDDLLDPEDFERLYTQSINKGTINDYKTKKLNMWVSASRAWLPDGAWSKCAHTFEFLPPSKGVVLGFDGSRNGDSTALVAVTVEECPKVLVLGLWEKPLDKDASVDWHVPREDVKQAIREACHKWDVREVAADEYIWITELEELADEGIPVVTYPQTMTRMGPATQRFYELVVTRQSLWHNGNPALARHIGNAQLRTDARGQMLQKDSKNSPRKIDAAVAAVMAVDRAGFWLTQDGPGTFNGMPVKQIHFVW